MDDYQILTAFAIFEGKDVTVLVPGIGGKFFGTQNETVGGTDFIFE